MTDVDNNSGQRTTHVEWSATKGGFNNFKNNLGTWR